jgi:ribonuclease P protein component
MGLSRLGLSVNKKIGKAVKRNWVKRRLREAIKSVLVMGNNHYDIVLLARKPVIHSKYKDIVAALQNSIEKIINNEAVGNSLS